MSKPVTCATCRHWLPKETPLWAARMHMACCALKSTKAVTMAHWSACRLHAVADVEVVKTRALWLKPAHDTPPGLGPFGTLPTAGHSRRDLGLFHGAAKGVK